MQKKPSFKEIKSILGFDWELCLPNWEKMYSTHELAGGCWFGNKLYAKNLKTGEKAVYIIKD